MRGHDVRDTEEPVKGEGDDPAGQDPMRVHEIRPGSPTLAHGRGEERAEQGRHLDNTPWLSLQVRHDRAVGEALKALREVREPLDLDVVECSYAALSGTRGARIVMSLSALRA